MRHLVLALSFLAASLSAQVAQGPEAPGSKPLSFQEFYARRDSCGCHQLARNVDSRSPHAELQIHQIPVALGAGPCSPSEFAALSGMALVNALADGGGSCVESLWSFDADVANVIQPANVNLVANTITAESGSLTTNAARVENLLLFFQIAFYHAFYESSVNYDPATFALAQQAVVDVAGSGNFFDETASIIEMRAQWAIAIDAVNATHLVLDEVEQVLERYLTNPTFASDYGERLTVYNCLFSLSRQILNQSLELGAASPWYSAIDADLVDVLDDFALDYAYTPETEYLVTNALWVFARFSYLDPATVTIGRATESEAYRNFPLYSLPWFRSVIELEAFYDGQLDDGSFLDTETIRDDVEAFALPNTWSFDQGRIVIKTPLSQSRCAELYTELKEVQAQFFRKCGFLEPVAGDANERITMVIYGSPDDYQSIQPFLYGYSTANGGIYIEGDGTLFTYDRTPAQSIYTLEELLRHEYVHYLDGRYLVRGGWYESGGLYIGGRLDWYGEGLAELLVGSTRRQGVLSRAIMLSQVSNDASRMSVAEIVNATYGSFTFYRYACTFLDFLDEEHPSRLRDLFSRIRSDDASAVDAWIDGAAVDVALQVDYDDWLDMRIAQLSGGATFAEDVPTTPTPPVLPGDNASLVAGTLNAQLPPRPLADFRASTNRWRDTNFLELPAPGATADEVHALLEAEADLILGQLEAQGANFANAVAWFGDVRIGPVRSRAEFVFEGPYSATAADTAAPASPQSLIATPRASGVSLRWRPVLTADLSGYRVLRSASSGGPYEEITTFLLADPRFVDASPIAGGPGYYVVVAEDAAGNQSLTSNEVAAESSSSILVVNGYFDDGNGSYYSAYQSALDAAGYSYDTWDPFVDGPVTTSLLLDYVDGLVIWPVGYLNNSSFPNQLGAARQASLSAYLAAGGSLMLSGAYTANQLQNTSLFTSYFHVDFIQFSFDMDGLTGVPGTLGDGATLETTSTYYATEVDPIPPAVAAFLFDAPPPPDTLDSTGTGIVTVDAAHHLTYLTFPFSNLAPASRVELLTRVVSRALPSASADLQVVPGKAGSINTIALAGAPANETAYLIFGVLDGSVPSPCPSTVDIGIANSILLGAFPTNAQGELALPVPVPISAHNWTLYFQVGVLPTCNVSNVELVTF